MPTGRGYRRGQTAAGSADRADSYQQVTDRIISALESGTVPWRKPWTSGGWPASMSTGKRYRGVNVLLLGFTDFPSRWWGTYNQIAELSGMVHGINPQTGRLGWYSPDGTPRGVRAGEKGQMITFWKELQREDPDQTDPETGQPAVRRIPMLRTFYVFNACQAEQLPERFQPVQREVEADADAESVIGAYLATGRAASLTHDVHGRAYYVPATDQIHLPPASEHTSASRYYSTLFHELTHSTGHASRLNRAGITDKGATFGCDLYGREELVAEMGAAFLCAETGTENAGTVEESGAYLRSWLETIKGDKRLVVQAASAAQRAADLVMEPSRQAVAEPETEREAAA